MTADEFIHWLRTPPSSRRVLMMGVMNATPDSFSDGGKMPNFTAISQAASQMLSTGADVIDVGGESTRPGSLPVAAEEQIQRVVPVIAELRDLARESGLGPPAISIDTTRADVAAAALAAGASIVNDVSAGVDDPQMLPLVAGRGLPIVLMHMKGTPATMQQDPQYRDVTAEVADFLNERVDAARSVGIPRERILLDPGIGFGKTDAHNLQLLRELRRLSHLIGGLPLLVGTSRKGFIGKITGVSKPADRLFGTAATIAWSVANGAGVLRVHDVAEMAQVARMVEAIVGKEYAEGL